VVLSTSDTLVLPPTPTAYHRDGISVIARMGY
jgi:hypothetical protein